MNHILVQKADILAHEIYKNTRSFPKSELFGIVSQLRRSALSIPLNIIEGFARHKKKEHLHFLEIAYGSLKETKYLIHFSFKEAYIIKNEYNRMIGLAEEIGKLIWTKMQRINGQVTSNE